MRRIAQASVKSTDLVVTSGEVYLSLFKNLQRLLRWIVPPCFFPSPVRSTLPDPIMAFGVSTCQRYEPLSTLAQGMLLLRSWLRRSRWKWKARILSLESPGLRLDRSTWPVPVSFTQDLVQIRSVRQDLMGVRVLKTIYVFPLSHACHTLGFYYCWVLCAQ